MTPTKQPPGLSARFMLLLKLEDAFAKSIRTKDVKFGRVKALLSEEPEAGRWKEVVLSVVATSALKLFIGSIQ